MTITLFLDKEFGNVWEESKNWRRFFWNKRSFQIEFVSGLLETKDIEETTQHAVGGVITKMGGFLVLQGSVSRPSQPIKGHVVCSLKC